MKIKIASESCKVKPSAKSAAKPSEANGNNNATLSNRNGHQTSSTFDAVSASSKVRQNERTSTMKYTREYSDIDIEEACDDVDRLIESSPSFSFSGSHRHHNKCQNANVEWKTQEAYNHGQRKRKRRRTSAVAATKHTDRADRKICTIWLWTMALMVPFSLIISTGERDRVIMAPGQTRSIVFPAIMTESIHVHRSNSLSTVGAENFTVHKFKGPCPELTGPVNIMRSIENLSLLPGQYEYRSMFLNQGSQVNVNLTALEGGAEIFLLKGDASFGEWRDHPGYRAFATAAVRRGDKSEGPAKQKLHIAHEILSSDTFYLVYYNRKQKKAAYVTASVSVAMTTHNLQAYTDDSGAKSGSEEVVCDNSRDCDIKTSVWRESCIIIKSEDSVTGFDSDLDKFPMLSLFISRHRRWSVIYVVSVVTLFLAIFHADRDCTCGYGDFDSADDDEKSSAGSSKRIGALTTETTPLVSRHSSDPSLMQSTLPSVSHEIDVSPTEDRMDTLSDDDSTRKVISWATPLATDMYCRTSSPVAA